MAIVGALALAGSTPVGTLGASLLVAAGSSIDQNLLFPWLFPPDDIEGERIQGLEVPQGREGVGMAQYQGEARCQGFRLYQSVYRQIEQTTSVGGKNGPDSTTFRAETDVLVAFSAEDPEQALQSGKSGLVRELYIDGELAWTDQALIDYVIPQAYETTSSTQLVGSIASPSFRKRLTVTSSGSDFTDFIPGFPITISGMQNPENNITPGGTSVLDGAVPVVVEPNRIVFEVSDDQGGGDNFIEESGAGGSVQLTQFLNDFQSDSFEQIELLPYDVDPHASGSPSQGALTELASSKELASYTDVPGYGRFAGVFLRSLNVTKYGNRMPTFHAVFRDAPLIAGQVYRDVTRKVGLGDAEVEISSKAGTLRGYKRDGVAAGLDSLLPMLAVNNAQAVETNGKLRIYRRDEATVWNIPRGEIGAQDVGEPAQKLPAALASQTRRPQRVTVEFSGVDEDFQVVSESVRLPFKGGAQEKMSLRQLTMERSEARAVALRALAEGTRDQVQISIPARWIKVQAGDVIRTDTDDGIQIEVEIRNRTREPLTGRLALEVVRRATEVDTFNPAVLP